MMKVRVFVLMNLIFGISKIVKNTSIVFLALLVFVCNGNASVVEEAFRIGLTKEESEFLEKPIKLKVIYDADWAPFESYDEENKTIVGINYDIISQVSRLTGIEFELIPSFDYVQSLEELKNKKVDMLLSFDSASDIVKNYNALIGDTYLSMPIAIIGREFQIKRDSVLAVSSIRPTIMEYVEKSFPENEILVYSDMDEIYQALKNGDVDFSFENLYTVREALATGEHGYFNIVSILSMDDELSYVYRDDISPILINIINKTLSYVDDSIIDEMLFYSASEMSIKTKTSLFFAKNSQLIIYISITVLIALVLSLLTTLILQIRTKNKLWKLAYIDSLTGMPNLSLFKLRASEILADRAHKKYVMIKLDIVKFNTINGVYGKEVGDYILKSIAEYGLSDLGDDEVCARIGIDSFIVLFKYENLSDSDARAEKFAQTLSTKVNFQLRFHIGRYLIPSNENDIEVIYEKVSFAHHYARQNANTPIIFDYDGTAREIELRHREIDAIMEDALANNDYIVYLQGKYNIHTGELVGAEALVRWQFADGTPVSLPSEFIPLFERNGFITQLDYYIFENCCRILRDWIDTGSRVVTISVNFSRLHLQDPNFIQTLVAAADKYNIPKHLLEIELTESAMFDNIETLVTVLAELHEAGFTLSMDDFGAGYSSLGLLKDLPVDVIKLDRSFFVGNRDKARSKVVLASIFSMAKSLNIKTLAEGVEYEDQVLLLRGLGCEVVQGFFFAKPIRHDQFILEDKKMDF